MPRFQQRLAALGEHPLIGEARGVGVVGALELVTDKPGKTAFRRDRGCRTDRPGPGQVDEGWSLRNIADAIAVCPRDHHRRAQIDELFDELGQGRWTMPRCRR
jgi:4-aminobutyrate--pyruvate transaminase